MSESDAVVSNGEADPSAGPHQFDVNSLRAGMLDGIVDGFLRDSEQVRGDVVVMHAQFRFAHEPTANPRAFLHHLDELRESGTKTVGIDIDGHQPL